MAKLLEEFPKCFLENVKETISMMTGFALEEAKLEETTTKYDLAGMILLSGIENIIFCISTSFDSGALISSYMTGTELEELEKDEIFDGIAELVNIAVGMVKTMAENEGYNLRISPPVSIEGMGIKFITKQYVKRYEYLVKSAEIELKLDMAII